MKIHNDIQQQARHWLVVLHSGQASAQQWQQFKAWLQQDSRHQQSYRDAELLWRQSTYTETVADQVATLPTSTPKRRQALWWLAACVALLALLLPFVPTPPEKQMFSTARGQIQTFRLEDGSSLTLGGDSMAEVSLSKHARQVVLKKGDGVFDVAPDPQRPFVVAVRHNQIRVLGTLFDVQQTGERVQVSVAHGRVEVSQNNQTQLLTDNQAVVLAPQRISAVTALGAGQFANWRQHRFNFEDSTLQDVISVLNRYGKVNLKLSHPSLATQRLTAAFRLDQLEQMLDALQLSHNIHWHQDPQGVIWLSI